MYGPPPHPQQVELAWGLTDAPGAWALTLLVGLALLALAWRIRGRQVAALALLAAGGTTVLTAPALGMLGQAVWGAYPTIDKRGSLLYYSEGVHWTMLQHPLSLADFAPARLIGVHVGHLWLTELFDIFLPTFGAFGAQALFNLILAWFCASLFLRSLCGDARIAAVLGLPFGLCLHLFRDIEWYTVEKTAVFVLPLYAWAWLGVVRQGGRWRWGAALVVLLAAWLNLYLALVIGLCAGIATVLGAAQAVVGGQAGVGRQAISVGAQGKHLAQSYGLTILLLLPLALLQASLLSQGATLASPECFLEMRAALDTLTLWPPAWNRLELWRALDPLVVLLALVTLRRGASVRSSVIIIGTSLVAATLSLGPYVLGLHNPVYMLFWYLVPFFWRIAKPEVFFFVSWLGVLATLSLGLSRSELSRGRVMALGGALALSWILLVRTHPVYPNFTEYQPAELPADWQTRLPRGPDCPS